MTRRVPSNPSAKAIQRRGVSVLWNVVLVTLLPVAALTAATFALTLLDPTSHELPYQSALLWPDYGAKFCLLDLLALATAVTAYRHGPRRFAATVGAAAVVGLIGSATATAQIVRAAADAGGSVNPLVLWPAASAAAWDSRENYVSDGIALDALIYRPTQAERAAPIYLYIHGGGWFHGSAADRAERMRATADRGFLVISIDYRLATPGEPAWDKSPRDAACALVWAQQNGPRLGGDPARIVLAGDSAGGNLAINLGYAAALGQAESGCGGTVPVPKAIIVQYPVVDPLDTYFNGATFLGIHAAPSGFTSLYVGGTPQEVPERYRAITSATYLSDKAPQTLLLEPDKDGFIPSAGVYRFAALAQAAGVDLTLVKIPFASHGYDASVLGDQLYTSVTDHYLTQRGLMPAR